uniref:Membrane protein of ER body-like protein n=1 Tax=Glycine max TaxID=3847 RepID=A0A368UIL4_SOYBN
MEQEGHQWIVHPHEEEEEIMEDGALIRKQTVSHNKGNFITDELTFSSSSSSSSSSNGSEHSNGVCSVVTAPPDGYPVQKEEEVAEIGGVGENCNHVNGDIVDYAAVGLAQVAEFAGTETNGEAISGVVMSQNKNSVYFDEQQGMWKCHHCTWTKRFDSPWTVPNWNLKGYPDLMTIKTRIQHGPCFVCETKDDEVNGLNGVQNGDASVSVHLTNLGEREFDVQADQLVFQNSLCSEISDQCMKTVDNKLPSTTEISHLHNSSDIQATAITNFPEETSTKEAPILIEEIDEQLEEFDVEAVLAKQETHDLFCPNCRSCITKRVSSKKEKGKCLDMFRFDGASKSESARNPPIIPASNLQNPSIPQGSNANWLTSLFTWKKGGKTSDAPLEHSGAGSAEQRNSTLNSNDEPTSLEIGPSKGPLADTSDIKNVKSTSNIKHGHGGMNSLISSTNDLSSIQSGTKGAGDLMNGVQSDVQNSVDFLAEKQLLAGNQIFGKEEKKNASVDIIRTGGDVILDVERGAFESTTSHTADNIPAEDAIITELQTQVQNGEQPRDEVGEPQGWEILKSIVYGGLVESITSLGIVSSAVSSGATPLNIIALGFANIIGGLFILGDNLIDLKKDNSGEDQMQTNAQNRYQESLGRRENFLLHAVVAVLSFLIFGAVPLVIYGLLINKNYHTEVKLATVAATSIVCIILLAIGKVYTSKAPKSYIKTVLYYVTLAISASGVSYIAGNLIKDFLEKLNQPESGFAITMPISDTSMGSAWMSY